MKKKYYAVITNKNVGVYDQWFIVNKIKEENPIFKCVKFDQKYEAVGYIRSQLSEKDWYDYCLDRCPMFLNKTFVRKKRYIAVKESKKREEEELRDTRKNEYI